MNLTDLQKQMLNGELGEPVRQSMELIVELGKFWDAPALIPVQSVHMPGASAKTARRAGRKHIKLMADEGGKFVTTTTLNPAAADLTGIDMGVGEETMRQQLEITDSYKRMGAVVCHTCTPYLVGNTPKVGEHVAWGESSAVVYANSVLGARTNREGGPSALATALTGFTACYGMHFKENRLATIQAKVEYPLNDVSDFGCAAYYLAKNFPDAVPVFTGLPEYTPTYALKEIAAALAAAGSVSLFHAVGLHPRGSDPRSRDRRQKGRDHQDRRQGNRRIQEVSGPHKHFFRDRLRLYRLPSYGFPGNQDFGRPPERQKGQPRHEGFGFSLQTVSGTSAKDLA